MTGQDKGFKFDEIRLLWRLAKEAEIEEPMKLYQNPASLQVADFIGNPRINFIDGEGSLNANGELVVDSIFGQMTFSKEYLTDDIPAASAFPVVLGIRPEKIWIEKPGSSNTTPGAVYSIQPAGADTTIHLKVKDEILIAKEMGIRNYPIDSQVGVRIDQNLMNVFSKDSGKIIKTAALEE